MSATSYADLAQLLSDGLDLCVRARKLDELCERSMVASGPDGMRCATPAVWIMDQYDNDLAAWEAKSRSALQQLAVP